MGLWHGDTQSPCRTEPTRGQLAKLAKLPVSPLSRAARPLHFHVVKTGHKLLFALKKSLVPCVHFKGSKCLSIVWE